MMSWVHVIHDIIVVPHDMSNVPHDMYPRYVNMSWGTYMSWVHVVGTCRGYMSWGTSEMSWVTIPHC